MITLTDLCYDLIRQPFTPGQAAELDARADEVSNLLGAHQQDCPRFLWPRPSAPECAVCATAMEAYATLASLAEAAAMPQPGQTVEYRGSLTEAHGKYVCGGPCGCSICDEEGDRRLVLLDSMTRDAALNCVGAGSVTIL